MLPDEALKSMKVMSATLCYVTAVVATSPKASVSKAGGDCTKSGRAR
jgi:hypothetical protein